MRSGDLTTGATKLQKSWKKLRERWEETKPHWNDSVSRDFEKNCLEELELQIVATFERMRGLATVLGAAEQECDH